MSDKKSLLGKGVVVVGASSGIGYAVARLMALHGAGVVVNGRTAATVDRAVQGIRIKGGRAVGVAGSAADAVVADELIETCTKQFGSLDVLVNCAGIPEPQGSSILRVNPWDWRAQLESHLSTAFTTCRAAAPIMVAQGGGSIINTSSFAFLGDYGGTGYAAAKGAVNSLTMAIAAELREHSVRANVVCPGARTRLSSGFAHEARILELYRRQMIDRTTMQGALDPPPAEYVAPLYLYLAGAASASVTGEIFVAAGGFVGRYQRPAPTVLGYRDHRDAPAWSIEDLHQMIGPT
ncbi:SDR family oxidoreductase [Nocardia sp. NPDC004654]|uniref:SDR family NAD(P)-dependent oxidoreductase n=1 Tax=Nocardia sp. NPDC004654 TaxID=3154776 RepID=UPI0033BCE98E